jgi:RNA-directed DNA polymerase
MAIAAATDRTRDLQRTLYRAAKADPRRRFHALHDKVLRRDVLERAWRRVRANRGAAGSDRQTIERVERYGVARLLDELEADLRAGGYRLLPARRAFIPKPGSGGAAAAVDSGGPRPRRAGGREGRHRADLRGRLPAVLVRLSAEEGAARRPPGARG